MLSFVKNSMNTILVSLENLPISSRKEWELGPLSVWRTLHAYTDRISSRDAFFRTVLQGESEVVVRSNYKCRALETHPAVASIATTRLPLRTHCLPRKTIDCKWSCFAWRSETVPTHGRTASSSAFAFVSPWRRSSQRSSRTHPQAHLVVTLHHTKMARCNDGPLWQSSPESVICAMHLTPSDIPMDQSMALRALFLGSGPPDPRTLCTLTNDLAIFHVPYEGVVYRVTGRRDANFSCIDPKQHVIQTETREDLQDDPEGDRPSWRSM